jgi:hypothetical protein
MRRGDGESRRRGDGEARKLKGSKDKRQDTFSEGSVLPITADSD